MNGHKELVVNLLIKMAMLHYDCVSAHTPGLIEAVLDGAKASAMDADESSKSRVDGGARDVECRACRACRAVQGSRGLNHGPRPRLTINVSTDVF